MCLYVTRRYVHTNGRTEIAAEWVYCRDSNRRSPCINVSRRDECVQVGSSSDFPDLVSHDGASTVSSSMPATPISATSPAGPLPIRYPGAKYEDRSPSRSPSGRVTRYRLSFNSESRPSRHARPVAPRPVVLQPVLPSSPGHSRRVELPQPLRTSHMRARSDPEYEGSFLSPQTAVDRARAQEQLQREERLRRREEQEADLKRIEAENGRQVAEAALRDEEREARELMLDEQEARTADRLLGRERLREEARRRREAEAHNQLDARDAVQRERSPSSLRRHIDEATRESESRQRESIERDQVDRLRRQIREGREREAQQRRERDEQARRSRDNQIHRQQREQERSEYESQRQRLRQQLEEAEQHLAHVEAQMHERQAREASRQEQLRRAQQDFEELDRRIRARERRAQIDGPRLGERRNITASQSPHLDSFLGPATALDDARFRRSRGEEVLEEARQTASAWDEDDGDVGRLRVPLLRRNTVGGRERARETNYRQRMRRYPS